MAVIIQEILKYKITEVSFKKYEVLSYAVPAFHFSLPKYLMQELERIQKRAMSIICPSVSYHEALVITNFKELATHVDEI